MYQGAHLSAALAMVTVLAGCSTDRSNARATGTAELAAAAAESVTVKATDFAFEAPEKIAAGAVTIVMENHGKELHQVQLVRLEEGKTVEDFAAAMKSHGPSPSWVKWVGGPNAAVPGQQSNATSVLEPGQYAYLCLIPSPDGKLHVTKGMVRPFEVTAESSATAAELPAADVTIKLVDYDFKPSQPLAPGRHTIMVENAGPQPHELVVIRLAPGKKVEDFAKWAESLKGPPPAQPVGGVVVLEKGGRGTFTVDLAPGDYAYICFVPDTKDGKYHFHHGMMKNFKVG